MTKYVVGFVAAAAAAYATWYVTPKEHHAADRPLYTVSPVLNLPDALACAASGGRAFMVADIDQSGNIASGWVAGCIVEADAQ